MKRAALSPVAARNRVRSKLPKPAGAPRPRATLRTIATGRATRHAYFNALCALVSPTR